jgi:D-glycero-D-manno-heptose 1,7-bisphosphate phosphatase
LSFEAPHFPEPGLFLQRLTDMDGRGKPCLFLDRDGVLVEETNYLHRTDDVVLIAGVAEAIARANNLDIPVVMVTNQAGIGRGYYSWAQFIEVQAFILERCREYGAHYDMVLACAYHAEGVPPYNRAAHPWRKPACGMLEEAARSLGVDLSRSYIVGDTLSDLSAGASAGLSGGTLVATGHGEREWRDGGETVFGQYRRTDTFKVGRASTAAGAIDMWLERISPAIHASG